MSLPSKDLEQLKQDAERLADQLPQSTSKDEALEVAIKAAETAMQALKLAQDPSEKAKLTTRLKQLLAEAEQIKLSKDWRATIQMSSGQPSNGTSNNTMATSSKQRVLKEPHSTRELSKSDQILLLKAGFLHGFKFPPWTSPPDPEEFELKDGEELFLYVSFVRTFFFSQTDRLTQSETPKIYHFLSFKKTCSMTGNDLLMLFLLHHGFRETAPI